MKAYPIIGIAAMVFFLQWASAQPTEIVISVDTAQSKNVGRSLTAALGLSLILPGAGELYLQDDASAKPFILTEVGFWFGLYLAFKASESYFQSARHAASQYGGIDASKKDEAFLAEMTRFRSYREIHHRKDSYEQSQILQGIPELDYSIPASPANYWDFGTPLIAENTKNWSRFNDSFKAYGRAQVVGSWMIGGLLLGRVAAFLHTLYLYRTTAVEGLASNKSGTNWVLEPEIGPGYAGAHFQVKF